MTHEFAKLRRNLGAGCRLALFLRVPRLAFRIDLAQLLLLFVVSALLDVGADWIRYGPDAQFSWSGATGEFVTMGLLLLCAAVLALAFRQHALALAIPVLVLSAYPIIQIAHVMQVIAAPVNAVPDWVEDAVDVGLLAWTFALFFRVVAIALVPAGPHRWGRVAAGGFVVAVSVAIAPALMPELPPWWHSASSPADGRYPNPASEPVLAAQATLLDDALSNLEDERGGEVDLYLIGFAGDAHEEPWRSDVLAAQRVMDERWDTRDRSIALINNPATLLEMPMATVTHLRETLKEIAAAIDTADDVVMLYLAGPAERGGMLGVAMPPLELAPVTPAVLRALLDEAGIRWRIVVVSACHAGAFAEALANDTTLVLTATGDGATYGCGRAAESTNLGAALFGDALLHGDSLRTAFEAAHARLLAGERGDTASAGKGAQLVVGPAMADKLKQLDRTRAARGAGRTV